MDQIMGFLNNKGNQFNKEREYIDYIHTHVNNVKRAFREYGTEICKAIDANWDQVRQNIENHDESKFENEEFIQYRKKWHPYDGEEFTPEDRVEYDRAWCHHINNNPHHPEYWIIPESPVYKVLDMPPEYIVEMICDWQSFDYIGRGNARDYYYYTHHKDGLLSPKTRELLEIGLEIINRRV